MGLSQSCLWSSYNLQSHRKVKKKLYRQQLTIATTFIT